jgi:hypothetical protein
MADRAAAVQSAIQVALSSPKAALAHIGWMRAERWLETLSSAELWCIRDVLVAESRTAFPPRLLECIATNDARRAAGELASGARQVLDVGALQHFAAASGFTPVPGYVNLSDWDQLVAADLLHRYGWTGHDPGRGFDAWEVQHQREMLEVMKQIRPPAIVKLSGTPTPQEARNKPWLRRAMRALGQSVASDPRKHQGARQRNILAGRRGGRPTTGNRVRHQSRA